MTTTESGPLGALRALADRWRACAIALTPQVIVSMAAVTRAEQYRSCADQLEAAIAAAPAPVAVESERLAWTVVGPDGKCSIGAWMPMEALPWSKSHATLREGHSYAYAYAAPQAAAQVTDADADALLLLASVIDDELKLWTGDHRQAARIATASVLERFHAAQATATRATAQGEGNGHG